MAGDEGSPALPLERFERALEQEVVGVEYLRTQQPAVSPVALESPRVPLRLLGPSQQEVERDLAC